MICISDNLWSVILSSINRRTFFFGASGPVRFRSIPTAFEWLCPYSFLRRFRVQRLFGHFLSRQDVNLSLALQIAQPLKLRHRLLLLRRVTERPLRLGELEPRHFVR